MTKKHANFPSKRKELKHLTKALQKSALNVCFHGEIRKIFAWYFLIFLHYSRIIKTEVKAQIRLH